MRALLRSRCMAFAARGTTTHNQRLKTCAVLNKSYTSFASSLVLNSSSSFNPPEPPVSKGQSVFPNINFLDSLDNTSQALLRNKDPDAVFVVSGASRGIGLQFVKSLVNRTSGTIVACCRSPSTVTGLNDFVQTTNRVHVVELDVEKQESIERAISSIKKKFNRIDLLLNVAGILGDGKTTAGPERSISNMDRDWMEKTMSVNVIGPMMLCKECVPLMKSKMRGKSKGHPKTRPIPVVANLSARVGSISDNELGGWYSYRVSKTALNQATRTLAHELKRQGTWCIALHPGTTDTDLSKPFQRNVQEGRLFPVDFTVSKLLDVIESMREQNSGGLYDWGGKAIPF